MSSFASLKKSSNSNIEKLHKAIESLSQQNTSDDKYWKPAVDKTGNGYSIIRFLPAPPQDGDDGLPWVKMYDHGFQGPTGLWYIEKSLSTIGQTDEIARFNGELWNSGIESNKEQARKQKRRLHYISNIYIIKDSKNPENEGQVKLFSYGKKIFEKVITAMKPQFEDDIAFDPFNFWEGANFKLKIRKFDGYQNYDLSEFETPGPLFEDDEKMEQIWNKQYSLKEIIDPKNFKSQEELKARLEKVLNLSTKSVSNIKTEENKMEQSFEKQNFTKSNTEMPVDFESDDEDLKFFQSLIDE